MNRKSGDLKALPTDGAVDCELAFGTYNMWIRSVVSGFYDLHHAGLINLKVRTSQAPFGLAPLVQATIDGTRRVIYDGHDGYNFLDREVQPDRRFDEMLDDYDLWFKYNCIESKHSNLRNRDKIRPLGLISGFFGSRHNPYDLGLVPFNPRQLVQTLIGVSEIGSSLTGKNSRHMWPDMYEIPPSTADGRAVFVARAWDPAAREVQSDQSRLERHELNEFRADVVRTARRTLGDCFLGGLIRDGYTERTYPDCIYDGPEAVNRWAYLQTLRGASVGIATAGLHGCSGGKLAEYVAASKGVVSTKLSMTLPGEFADGVNYLGASTAEELIASCATLLDSPSLLAEMMGANRAYYEAFVRPSACVLRTIGDALR